MKPFKNNLTATGNLFQLSSTNILKAYCAVNDKYNEVPTWEHSPEFRIEARTELRHTRRELFNIFNALTGLS